MARSWKANKTGKVGKASVKKGSKKTRSQMFKDAESLVSLDKSIEDAQREIRKQIDNASPQLANEESAKPEGYEVLKSINELAESSVSKNRSDRSLPNGQDKQMPSSLLECLDSINVSGQRIRTKNPDKQATAKSSAPLEIDI